MSGKLMLISIHTGLGLCMIRGLVLLTTRSSISTQKIKYIVRPFLDQSLNAPLHFMINITEMKPCGMKVTHQNFLKYNLAFALPDESPIAEKINKGTPIRDWYSSHLT